MNALLTRWRRLAVAIAAAATIAAAMVAVPASTVHAQAPACVTVEYQASTWSTGPESGGFAITIVLTNTCSFPINGWTLELGLGSGQTMVHGWSAQWVSAGGQVTASNLEWNAVLSPGAAIAIGFIGAYVGTFQEPVSCLVNGFPCAGGPDPNEPPEVTLTSPAEGFQDVLGCLVTFAADANDPDGSVDRVEFYVNDSLVGTAEEAPYEIEIRGSMMVGGNTAFARAFDDGAPALSTDSEKVTFDMTPPPPGTPVDPCRTGVPPIPPEVTLTSPADGDGIVVPCAIRLAADAFDPDGWVERVEFYVNDQLVGVDQDAPYQVDIPADHPALSGSMTGHRAAARAFDSGDPQQVGFSPQVSFFQVVPPPSLFLMACLYQPVLEVPEGGSDEVVFFGVCDGESPVGLTVEGDAAITVSPSSFPAQLAGIEVTVSAAPGSAGATATVTANASGCGQTQVPVTVVG